MSGGGARGGERGERRGAPRGGVARARRRRGRRVLAAHPDEAHVGRKVLEARVLALGDVLLHRAEVHRLLDQPRVVVQPHLLPVDGLGKVDRLRALQQRLEVGVALPAQRLVHRVEDEPRLRPLVAVPALRAGEGARLRLSSGRDSDGTRCAWKIAGARSRRSFSGACVGIAGERSRCCRPEICSGNGCAVGGEMGAHPAVLTRRSASEAPENRATGRYGASVRGDGRQARTSILTGEPGNAPR